MIGFTALGAGTLTRDCTAVPATAVTTIRPAVKSGKTAADGPPMAASGLVRLWRQNCPADMDCAIAAAHRQVKWRAYCGIRRDGGQRRWQYFGIALRPHHDGALF